MRPCGPRRIPRPLPGLALPLALSLCFALSGCFVIDELNKGQEIMDKHNMGGGSDDEEEGSGPAFPDLFAGSDDEEEGEPRKSLWEGGRTLDPGEMDGEIARCTLGGSVQFMNRSDCLARGGDPG